MGLFGLTRKEKETWTSIVIQGLKPGMQIDDVLLKNATDTYITQHIRILEDSVRRYRARYNVTVDQRKNNEKRDS